VVHCGGAEWRVYSPTAVIFNTFNTLRHGYVYIYIYFCVLYISSAMFVRIESQYWRDEDEPPNPMMRKRGRKLMTFRTGGIYIVVIFIFFHPLVFHNPRYGRRGRSDGQHIIHTRVFQYSYTQGGYIYIHLGYTIIYIYITCLLYKVTYIL